MKSKHCLREDEYKQNCLFINMSSDVSSLYGIVGIGVSLLGFYYWALRQSSEQGSLDGPEQPVSPTINPFLESLRAMEERELTDDERKDLLHKIIKKTDNVGEPVFMSYNWKIDTFQYWSDKRTIPYEVLDSIALEYVIKYNCKEIFVDISAPNKESDDGEAESMPPVNSHVYARFKNYTKDTVPLVSNANSFRRVGSLDDFAVPQPVTAQPADVSSYASWAKKSKSV